MGIMPAQIKPTAGYRTRFAPSPTGPLHFGSMVTAMGSWLRAMSLGGVWLVRVEDIDPPREHPLAKRLQFRTLSDFGLFSQEPVRFQSARTDAYRSILQSLLRKDQAYPCACSAKSLPESGIYPGSCRQGLDGGTRGRSIRLKTHGEIIDFHDVLQGPQRQVPSEQTGDFIIRRGDGLFAYQLAVVVDDASQRITEVVRGADLLDSVGRQILLYRALNKPVPRYLHLPVIVDRDGRKLSKSDGADPLEKYDHRTVMRLVLRALGHEPPPGKESVAAQRDWALANWDLARIPKGPVSIEAL